MRSEFLWVVGQECECNLLQYANTYIPYLVHIPEKYTHRSKKSNVTFFAFTFPIANGLLLWWALKSYYVRDVSVNIMQNSIFVVRVQ